MRDRTPRLAGFLLALAVLLVAGACAGRTVDESNAGTANADANPNANADPGANATNNATSSGNNSTQEPRPADPGDNVANSNRGAGTPDPDPDPDPDPEPRFHAELAESSDDHRRTVWHIADPDVTLVLRFAEEGRSLLDGLPRPEHRSAVTESGRRIAAQAAHTVMRIRAWAREVKATLPPRPLRIELVESADDATNRGTLSMAHAMEFGIDAAVWDQALPAYVHRVLRVGLPLVAPHQVPETARRIRYYAWVWAPQVGLELGTVPELETLATRTDFTASDRWQLGDFVGWLMGTYNPSAVASAMSVEGAKLFTDELPRLWEAWRVDRQTLLDAAGRQDPKLVTAWHADAGDWKTALEVLPDLLTAKSMRNLRKPAMNHGFAEVAFLAGRFDFVWLWVRERLMEPEYNVELLRPMDPPAAPQLVPMRHVPAFAALAPAMLSTEDATLAAKLFERAGLRQHARLTRWLRGVIDDPGEPELRDRLLAWGATETGDEGLVRFALAAALRAIGRTQLAANHAAAIPAGSRYALAWSRLPADED